MATQERFPLGERTPNIPPPGIGGRVSRKGKVIPFQPRPDSEREALEASRKKLAEQNLERAATTPQNAPEGYEARIERLKSAVLKLPSEVKLLKSWWDSSAGKQRETREFTSDEVGKQNSPKTYTADYWITERNGSKDNMMVPGTLKEKEAP